MSRWRDPRFHPSGARPFWWPQDEPWPPRGSHMLRERRRARFVRRTGWYSFWPLWILIWIVLSNARWWGSWGGFPWFGGVPLLLLCAAIAGMIAVALRVVSGPLADLVSAADRI